MLLKNMKLGWATVANVEKTRSFMVDKLGLTEVDFNKDFGWLEVQAEDKKFTLGFGGVHQDSPYKPGNNAIITFGVEDIEAAKAELEKKGVIFTTDIYDIPGHVKMADFVDEDKNMYQLAQEL